MAGGAVPASALGAPAPASAVEASQAFPVPPLPPEPPTPGRPALPGLPPLPALPGLPSIPRPPSLPGLPSLPGRPTPPGAPLAITELGRYSAASTGAEFGASGAEIVAHDPRTQRLFVTNGAQNTVDVLDVRNPQTPTLVRQVDMTPFGAAVNGIGAGNGVVGVAVAPADPQGVRGRAVFLDPRTLAVRGNVEVGFLPDALLFTPDGRTAVVANEGEPSADYSRDPEGSVSIIDVARQTVREVGFRDIRGVDGSTRIFGPGATIAQDLEPENIAFSPDSRTAWVSLQENNALARIDLRRGTVEAITGLGFIDRRDPRNAFDPSDRDGGINFRTANVLGIPMPDSIGNLRSRGRDFIVTANEGDARAYAGFDEEARVSQLRLCQREYPDAATLQRPENLGRLVVTRVNGFDPVRQCYAQLHAFGGRSFSIYDANGTRVFDSGADFERITAERLGRNGFNANNNGPARTTFDTRSDDKGPEPEGLDVGRVGGRDYVFVGLERVGGFMTYDVTDPRAPRFVDYTTTRNLDATTPEESVDLGPEGVLFIEGRDSPTRRPLLVVTHEITGTTTIFGLGR